MPDAYAVMGHPVAHSRSPFIHSRFAEQTGESIRYEKIDVEPGTFPRAVAEFRDRGGRGFNVTVPFKEEAWALAVTRTERAARAGAANTMWFDGSGAMHADNTDGVGLVRDLERNAGVALAGRRILLLGAGGAARGVLGPLLSSGPAGIVIANRTHSRAERLVADFSPDGPVRAVRAAELPSGAFDLVINATSAGLSGEVPDVPAGVLAPGACCYDMMYGAEPTAFVVWARAAGAGLALDGIGMLVEQAAESFARWRGVRPETAEVIEALGRALGRVPERSDRGEAKSSS